MLNQNRDLIVALLLKLSGWLTTTVSEVQLEFCAFNNRPLVCDLEEVCRKVNKGAVILPDGERLVVAVGQRLRTNLDSAPQANTG